MEGRECLLAEERVYWSIAALRSNHSFDQAGVDNDFAAAPQLKGDFGDDVSVPLTRDH